MEKRGDLKGWRMYMPQVHGVCRELAIEGLIDIEQKKVKIHDFTNFKGIYRVRTTAKTRSATSTEEFVTKSAKKEVP